MGLCVVRVSGGYAHCLSCDHCGKFLVDGLCVVATAGDEPEKILQSTPVYVACKGECDKQMTMRFSPDGMKTGWNELSTAMRQIIHNCKIDLSKTSIVDDAE
jgi:hypothetical protein